MEFRQQPHSEIERQRRNVLQDAVDEYEMDHRWPLRVLRRRGEESMQYLEANERYQLSSRQYIGEISQCQEAVQQYEELDKGIPEVFKAWWRLSTKHKIQEERQLEVDQYEFNKSPVITWVKNSQLTEQFPVWEASWFEETTSTFRNTLPWTACEVKDCVLPNGHPRSHEIWRRCDVKDCLQHRDHDGDHRLRSEELRDAAVRLEKEAAQRKQKFWDDLAAMVLEAMVYPQSKEEQKPNTSTIIVLPAKPDPNKTLIPPPSLAKRKPSSPYRKLVLDNQQIRLFQLEPGRKTSDITGSFVCVELSSCPAYTALSYTWGDEQIRRKMAISGHDEIVIGDNLWSFLCLQRTVITHPTLFWIDAICIDQANTHERNHQVGLMKQIYANAAEVYVWLGQEANSSDIAMRFMASQASEPLRRRGPGYYPVWTRTQGEALQNLCERPYWRRMWIIQELLHANNITVWCGSLNFTWADLEKLYCKLAIVQESNWFAHHKFHLMVTQSSAAIMVWQRAHWRHPKTRRQRLQTLIQIFRDWKCSDPRDKVFALSAMAVPWSTVIPDYALTIREVYFAVMHNVGRDEQFGILLSQILGLAGCDIDMPDQAMIEYKTPDPQRLVLKARQHDWIDAIV
ncbi:heterokaryon incompatibility protein-domain-containing protein [Astrocystis sublimbata]|nr:heterokaryon incompatibility protein-domain-containing protein [Astrocystis sublimbata]